MKWPMSFFLSVVAITTIVCFFQWLSGYNVKVWWGDKPSEIERQK